MLIFHWDGNEQTIDGGAEFDDVGGAQFLRRTLPNAYPFQGMYDHVLYPDIGCVGNHVTRLMTIP
jgi:hypothetical protein